MKDFRMNAQRAAEEYRDKMIGKRYKHFKGGIYVVTGVAVHSETAGLIVIYRSYDGETKKVHTWARPMEMFLSEVDHEKYPDVDQIMRFEQLAELGGKA